MPDTLLIAGETQVNKTKIPPSRNLLPIGGNILLGQSILQGEGIYVTKNLINYKAITLSNYSG